MRIAALLPLLPALATLATAAPSGRPSAVGSTRKSLSFGPPLAHHSFETLDTHAQQLHARGLEDVDPVRAGASFIATRLGVKEGEGFFIREDVSGVGRERGGPSRQWQDSGT